MPATIHRLDRIAGALLGIAMMLLLRRYWGIDHDAALYLGEALVLRSPEIFGDDLFFLQGGQGSYTLMPWLLAHGLAWLEPASLFLWGALAGLLLFAAAGWYCLRALLPASQRYWAWLGVLVLPSMYGRSVVFSYAEPFLTPRPLAEALSLFAIGLAIRKHWYLAATCALLAAAFHPLQAIGMTLVAWPWALMQDRRWLHVAWLSIPLALLAYAGVAPFDGLARAIDPTWLAALRAFNGQLFVTGWSVVDYKLLAFDAFVLACAWRSLHAPFASWCLAALVGLALGISSSLLLVDVLHLELPAGLQLWRVHWLAHWFAVAAIAGLLYRDVQARDVPRTLLLVLIALLAWGESLWTWIPFALLYASWPFASSRVQPRVTRLLGILFALGLVVLLAAHVAQELISFRSSHYRLDLYAVDRRLLVFPLVALGLPLLGVFAWNRAGGTGRWILLAAALCPMLVLGAVRWDARPPIPRVLEQNAMRPDLFGEVLPAGAQVYWDSVSLVGTWLVLQRADYYSPQQLSGLVFSRATSIEASKRLARLDRILQESAFCRDTARPERERQGCFVTDEGMRLTCAPGPEGAPDYLVLPFHQPQRALGTWALTDESTGLPLAQYWLYGCPQVMEDLRSASGATR